MHSTVDQGSIHCTMYYKMLVELFVAFLTLQKSISQFQYWVFPLMKSSSVALEQPQLIRFFRFRVLHHSLFLINFCVDQYNFLPWFQRFLTIFFSLYKFPTKQGQ